MTSTDDDVWDVPWPYGLPAGIDSGATSVAPLLAGFSSALVGLVVTTAEAVRWPGAALSLLIASTVVFLMSVQAGVWMRSYAVVPSDIREWWPNTPDSDLRTIQRLHRRGYAIWRKRFHASYRVGILLLLSGLALTLLPPGHVGPLRWLAILIASVGFLAELGWIAANRILEGSRTWAIGDTADSPPADGPWWKQHEGIRRLARKVIPLVRIAPLPPVPAPPAPQTEQPSSTPD